MTIRENGTALVTGLLDVTINGIEKMDGVNATILLVHLPALNISLSRPDYLGEPIYRMAEPKQETVAASNGLLTEGSSIFGNITEKFRRPRLPNRSGS